MTGPVHAPIHVEGPQLHVLSAQYRLYAGLSRDESYLHVVHPAGFDQLDTDNNVVHRAGDLVCHCKGATYAGHCYRQRQAEALERGEADVDVWVAPETESEMAAARG